MHTTSSLEVGPDDAVDLHLHTLASDGRWTPVELTEYLTEHQFKIIAIADHDSMASVPGVTDRCGAAGIHVVPAVEMTTRWEERQVHCLVYGIDLQSPQSTVFRLLLERQQANLTATAERMVSLLERHGRRVPSLDEVTAGRRMTPHFVFTTMIKDGHGSNLFMAHNIIRGLGEEALVDVPLSETVDAVHKAGAVAVIAHPGRNDGWGFLYEDRLDTMRETVPIDGVEAHYRTYTTADVERYRNYAAEHNLLVSSGSDSHWSGHPVNPTPHPARWSVDLLTRLGIEVGPFEGPAWVPPQVPPEDSPAG